MIFAGVKNARKDDFEVYGLNDPTIEIRFMENLLPVLLLLGEGAVDVGLSVQSLLTEGNLLALLALISGPFLFQSDSMCYSVAFGLTSDFLITEVGLHFCLL